MTHACCTPLLPRFPFKVPARRSLSVCASRFVIYVFVLTASLYIFLASWLSDAARVERRIYECARRGLFAESKELEEMLVDGDAENRGFGVQEVNFFRCMLAFGKCESGSYDKSFGV